MNERESVLIRDRYPFLRNRVVTVNPFIAPTAEVLEAVAAGYETSEAFRVATIGGWEQRYNVVEAVRAALQFHRETGVPVEVTVLQSSNRRDVEYQEKLEREFAAARAEIRIAVFEDRHDVLQILGRQDAFIRPSELDSYGLCVAESLLVGTPAIATDVCPRCSAADLYQLGDIPALVRFLHTAYARRHERQGNLLTAAEDSFNAYYEIYQNKR